MELGATTIKMVMQEIKVVAVDDKGANCTRALNEDTLISVLLEQTQLILACSSRGLSLQLMKNWDVKVSLNLFDLAIKSLMRRGEMIKSLTW